MKLIPILLMLGMFAVSGRGEDEKPEPYFVELVKKTHRLPNIIETHIQTDQQRNVCSWLMLI
jgi:hypothetical protein